MKDSLKLSGVTRALVANHRQERISKSVKSSLSRCNGDRPPNYLAWHVQQKPNPCQGSISRITRIKWRCPPKVALNPSWHVVAGEVSEEAVTQKRRETTAREVVFRNSNSIPPSPFASANVVCESFDDRLTPIIPMIPIEEVEAAQPFDTSASDKVGSVPSNLHPSQSVPSGPEDQTVLNKSLPDMLRGLERTDLEIAVVAAATVAAVMEKKEQVDTQLMIKLLNDPELVKKLLDGSMPTSKPENGTPLETKKGTLSAAKNGIPPEPKNVALQAPENKTQPPSGKGTPLATKKRTLATKTKTPAAAKNGIPPESKKGDALAPENKTQLPTEKGTPLVTKKRSKPAAKNGIPPEPKNGGRLAPENKTQPPPDPNTSKTLPNPKAISGQSEPFRKPNPNTSSTIPKPKAISRQNKPVQKPNRDTSSFPSNTKTISGHREAVKKHSPNTCSPLLDPKPVSGSSPSNTKAISGQTEAIKKPSPNTCSPLLEPKPVSGSSPSNTKAISGQTEAIKKPSPNTCSPLLEPKPVSGSSPSNTKAISGQTEAIKKPSPNTCSPLLDPKPISGSSPSNTKAISGQSEAIKNPSPNTCSSLLEPKPISGPSELAEKQSGPVKKSSPSPSSNSTSAPVIGQVRPLTPHTSQPDEEIERLVNKYLAPDIARRMPVAPLYPYTHFPNRAAAQRMIHEYGAANAPLTEQTMIHEYGAPDVPLMENVMYGNGVEHGWGEHSVGPSPWTLAPTPLPPVMGESFVGTSPWVFAPTPLPPVTKHAFGSNFTAPGNFHFPPFLPQVPTPAPNVGLNYYDSHIKQHGKMHEMGEPKFPIIGQPANYLQGFELGHNNTSSTVMNRSRKQCLYFNTSKGCRNGDTCQYLHDVCERKAVGAMEFPVAKRTKLT